MMTYENSLFLLISSAGALTPTHEKTQTTWKLFTLLCLSDSGFVP